MFNKWTFNLHDCEFWGNELFDSKEKAIEKGTKFAKEEGFDGFYLGFSKEPVISINAYHVLEDIDDQLFEEVGDVSNGWCSSITKEEKDKLQNMLNKTFEKWMKETDNNFTCYKVTDIKYIEI